MLRKNCLDPLQCGAIAACEGDSAEWLESVAEKFGSTELISVWTVQLHADLNISVAEPSSGDRMGYL